MSYASPLQFLCGLQKHGVKLGLHTIASLLARVGDPHRRYPVCHIGGTNGKGSTAAMAASMLQAAGYRVGLYTSPHLIAFNERIRVAGHPIDDEQIVALTEQLRSASPIEDPTFFEFTTAIAFQHFAESGVDVAVVEVGMGGRYDATNVVMPLVSTITNVTLDHQDHLGNTVEAIAVEKAGIIKGRTPVVVGRLSSDASAVIDSIASERHSSVFRLNADFHADGESEASFRYEGMKRSIEDLSCPLPGVHQLENAACAIAMLELASEGGLAVPDGAIRSGLAAVRWEGRLQIVEHHPRLMVDGAHNPAAGRALATYLGRYRTQHSGSRIILIISMMRDKDHRGFFDAVLPVIDEIVMTRAQLDRAASVEELREALGPRTDAAFEAPSVPDALALARRLASCDDLICVAGSLMLVGEVKALLLGCAVSSLRG